MKPLSCDAVEYRHPILFKTELYFHQRPFSSTYGGAAAGPPSASEPSNYSEPHLGWPDGGETNVECTFAKATQAGEHNIMTSDLFDVSELEEGKSLTVEHLNAAIQTNGATLVRLRPFGRFGRSPLLSPHREVCNEGRSPPSCVPPSPNGVLRTAYFKTGKGESLPICFLESCERTPT
ncbi:hypothetical protein DQ04_00751000 [Trypanosoma grayi]|uniref:hypothetical protein n=1 Tax=Trypanosoma grayi TaxID=71804 RepID=UPI0004F4A5B0|nr:hypothetical protein DQ04_00751000 [Trypanosoma grayi]KEG13840.1 hypothetical protein DQ04_00751000 [Trypanosoma grayi]